MADATQQQHWRSARVSATLLDTGCMIAGAAWRVWHSCGEGVPTADFGAQCRRCLCAQQLALVSPLVVWSRFRHGHLLRTPCVLLGRVQPASQHVRSLRALLLLILRMSGLWCCLLLCRCLSSRWRLSRSAGRRSAAATRMHAASSSQSARTSPCRCEQDLCTRRCCSQCVLLHFRGRAMCCMCAAVT